MYSLSLFHCFQANNEIWCLKTCLPSLNATIPFQCSSLLISQSFPLCPYFFFLSLFFLNAVQRFSTNNCFSNRLWFLLLLWKEEVEEFLWNRSNIIVKVKQTNSKCLHTYKPTVLDPFPSKLFCLTEQIVEMRRRGEAESRTMYVESMLHICWRHLLH